jgi:trehalose 6-phosphate synthase
VVAEINARHTRNGQQPIDLRMVEDFPLAVAAYSICDVLMVNALADGMNLVAKEAAVVNRRDGVLVLSENTGAHHELGEQAVTVYPYDIRQQADALYEALTMPRDERRERLRAAAAIIERNDIAAWFSAQLDDLATGTATTGR